MDLKSIIVSLENIVDMNSIALLRSESNRKKMVYTSFDGDYMHFLFHMIDFTMKKGALPINPEAALGYYVSTKTHGGKKVPVMLDCIKTELLCDEMWVFNSEDGHIPEGVLAEMMVWARNSKNAVKLIPFFEGISLANWTSSPEFDSELVELNSEDIELYVSKLDQNYVREIKEKLFNGIEALPTSAYLVVNFSNYKHIDWAREYCYRNNYCPLSPQNLLSYFAYSSNFIEYQKVYLLDRLTLLEKADKLIWFTNLRNFDYEIKQLDRYSATEIYYWHKYKNPKDMVVVDWADAEVPKYMKNSGWALTSQEIMEVEGNMNNKLHEIFLEKIFIYEEQIENQYNIFKGNLLGNGERELITADMNAFIFGLISDQSVRAEIAWSLPFRLKKRMGYFDLKRILNEMDIDKLKKVIEEKPSLHRYPSNIAKYLYSACELIEKKYQGSASNIWSDGASALEIAKRLEEFKGISHKKAALGCLLLVRDLNVELPDKENINIAYDVHIRRICLRTGFVKQDTLEDVTAAGKTLYAKFPGRLTSTFWAIGRDICRPTNPRCTECPIESCCEKNIFLGGDINA